MNEQKIHLVVLLAIALVLIITACILSLVTDRYQRRLEKENKRLRRLMDEQFLMNNMSLDACRAMIREACRQREDEDI